MAETKELLIKAARKAFTDKGYADTSMDDLTADVGLTRGALYHNFGSKQGLLAAVVEQIDMEMASYAKSQGQAANSAWDAFLMEGKAYIKKALDKEVQRVVLKDGPSVLGDPSQWPSQNRCLHSTTETINKLISEGVMKKVDPEAAAVLINGAAMNAALWVASNDSPEGALPLSLEAFSIQMDGFLVN